MERKTKLVSLEEIFCDDTFNCRGEIPMASVQSLAEDIDERGLDQSIGIMPIKTNERPYMIVWGHRRYRAFELLGKERISAVICKDLDMETARIANIKENLERKELNIMQEARALIPFYSQGMSFNEVRKKLGVSQGWLQTRSMAMELPEEVQKLIEERKIDTNNIRDLYTVRKNPREISRYLGKVTKMKEKAKKAGKGKIVARPSVQGALTKRKRNSAQCLECIEVIQKACGYNLATRAIAWCNGGINDGQLFDALEKHCTDLGIDFTMPEEKVVE